ncbi:calcium-binding protein [Paenibacillus sp. FSL R10-2199]|uniref:calcium-binding protein n=1 Tax=Paenibacillus sp. FSL R10-2199 TaxID=2975348 RepID=UPI0030F5B89D
MSQLSDYQFMELCRLIYQKDYKLNKDQTITMDEFRGVPSSKWKVLSITDGVYFTGASFGLMRDGKLTGDVILACKGTDEKRDWLENLNLKWLTGEYESAIQLLNTTTAILKSEVSGGKLGTYTLNYAGHSLGGKLAQQLFIDSYEERGTFTDVRRSDLGRTVLFNAAPTQGRGKDLLSIPYTDYNITNYITEGEVLNSVLPSVPNDPPYGLGFLPFSTHYGKKVYLPYSREVNNAVDPITKHNAFDSFKYYFDDNGNYDSKYIYGTDVNDYIEGRATNDTIVGGAGNDILKGGDGSDTYKFFAGNGQDTINEIRDSKNTIDKLIIYGHSYDSMRVVFLSGQGISSMNRKIKIVFEGSTDSITLQYSYSSNDLVGCVEKVSLADISTNEIIKTIDMKELITGVLENYSPKFNVRNGLDALFDSLYNPQKAYIEPVILDLDGNANNNTVGIDDGGVHFDHGGDGFAEKTGWVNPEDGLLVRDINQDGIINNGSELFGQYTQLRDGSLAESGFEALLDLDGNGDGIINELDTAFKQLRIWQDDNADGITGQGELITLNERGITAFNLVDHGNLEWPDGTTGNIEVGQATYGTSDQTYHPMIEYSLKIAPYDTVANEWLEEPEAIQLVPDVAGSGLLYTFHQTMMRDTSGQLKLWIQQFQTETDLSVRNNLLDRMIYKWTGADQVEPDSRGGIVDAQKLVVIEKYYGVSQPGYVPPGDTAGTILEFYNDIKENVYAQLMAQTHLAFLYDEVSIVWGNDKFVVDLSGVQTRLQSSLLGGSSLAKLQLGEFMRTAKQLYNADAIGLSKFGNYFSSQNIEWAWIVESNLKSSIMGTSQGELLTGTAWDDAISGGDGNDILHGNKGNDALFGGLGNDTYMIGKDSGTVQIYEEDATAGNTDKILLGEGILPDNVKLSRDQYDLVVSIDNSVNKINVRNFFKSEKQRIESIVFANGNIWDVDYILNHAFTETNGTDQLDTFYGTSNNDKYRAGAGDDTAFGGAGHDTLMGEAGNDYLAGQSGNDTLDGGTGNDYLDGGIGNDTYIFGKGYGSDTIIDSDSTEGNYDRVLFNAGLLPNEITIVRNGTNLELVVTGTSDKLKIINYFGATSSVVEALSFSDGTVWDYNYVLNNAITPAVGAAGVTLTGTSGNDVLQGGVGNDKLYGGSGNDVLDGGAGDDKLYGDRLSSSSPYNSNGNDTYVFGKGYGQDTIYDVDTVSGYVDTIQMLVNPEEVDVLQDNMDLMIRIKETGEKIRVNSYFSGTKYKIEQVKFADGTMWTQLQLESKVITEGTEGHDVLYGVDGYVDWMRGLAGNDILYAGSGNDVLDGGSGDDMLYGDRLSSNSPYNSNGNDTYVFGKGYGQDTVYDVDSSSNVDTIQMLVNPEEVDVLQDNMDLMIRIKETGEKIRVNSYFNSSYYKIERVTFADGTVWTQTQLESKVITEGTIGDDSLRGVDGYVDWMQGLAGNDKLYAGSGNDVLDGGAGDDKLYGDRLSSNSPYNSNGNDTYVFGKGYGQDTIYDVDTVSGYVDTIQMLVNPEEVDVLQDNMDLMIRIKETGEKIRVNSYFSGTKYKIEQVKFADGTMWTQLQLESKVITEGTEGHDVLYGVDGYVDWMRGLAGNDILYAGSGNDVLDGGSGDDMLYGDRLSSNSPYNSNGNDTYVFGKGYGQDTVYDVDSSSNVDTIQMLVNPEEVDVLQDNMDLMIRIKETGEKIRVNSYFNSSYYKIERVTFADGTVWTQTQLESKVITEGTIGDDSLRGVDGYVDWMQGLAGNDKLYAGSGNDVLDGGAGDDKLYGDRLSSNSPYNSNGNDTYVFGKGYGQDTIYDVDTVSGYVDTIQMLVNPEEVDVLQDNMDLMIRIKETGEKIRVNSYFSGTKYKIEQVKFADGTMWTQLQLESKVITEGTEGHDVLYGVDGYVDWMRGLAGNDILYAGSGNDVLDGGSGDDMLYGDRLSSNSPYNSNGNDTYVFGKGYGQDTVYDVDSSSNVDTIQMLVNPEEVDVLQDNMDLMIRIKETGEKIRVNSYFNSSYYKIERVTFADGTVWTQTQLESKVITEGTIGDDSLRGVDGYVDWMQGLAGNDKLYAGSGNDVLDGGAGDDKLYGDRLSSNSPYNSNGNDTYVFGKGYGQDTIYDVDTVSGYVDTIQMLVNPEEVDVLQDNMDLMIRIKETGEKIRVNSYFSGTKYKIEQVKFADGTMWTQLQLESKVITEGTEGHDVLYGVDGYVDWMRGLAGNDILYAGSGNDVLDGGSGDDMLYGDRLSSNSPYNSNGNDTYVFGKGYGQDTVYDVDSSSNVDTIQMLVNPEEVDVLQDNMDLMIRIKETGEKIRVNSYFNSSYYKIERVTFADGTVWTQTQLESKVITEGTIGDDSLRGVDGYVDWMQGLAGNDKLYAGSGNDVLDGGAGDDKLYGDRLSSNSPYNSNGNDTYVFGKGYGQDTIYDVDSSSNVDTIQMLVGPEEVDVMQDNMDLMIRIKETGEKIRVNSYFTSSYYKVERVTFADGTYWTQTQLEFNVITQAAAKNANLLKNNSYNVEAASQAAISAQTEQLIQAMSTFSATSDMDTSQFASEKRYTELPVLTESWTKI